MEVPEKLVDILRGQIRYDRFDGNPGVDGGKTARGGDGFRNPFLGIPFVVEPLALQIAQFDVVPIDQAKHSHASAGKSAGVEAAEGAAADNTDTRLKQLFLPRFTDARKQELAGVPIPLRSRHIQESYQSILVSWRFVTNGIRSMLFPALLAGVAAGVLMAAPVDYEGQPIVAIRFEPPNQPLQADQITQLLPFRQGDKLKLSDIRLAIQRLHESGRYQDIAVDATRSGEGVVLTFKTTGNWFIGRVTVDGVPPPPNRGQLVNSTKLALGSEYSDEDLQAAIENLQAVLRNNGFYEARINPVLSRDPATTEISIRFEVSPGPRARFAMPIIKGQPERDADDISGATGWKRFYGLLGWKTVTENRVQQGLERIRRSYLSKDHLMARVTLDGMEYDPKSKTVTPTLTVDAGPRVTVRTRGARVSRGKLRELIPIYQEQSVDRDLLVEGMHNLEELFQAEGYFDVKVSFDVSKRQDGREVILYRINRGQRSKLVHLDVSGNQYFDDETIRERMYITPATRLRYRHGRFSMDMLERDKEAIADLYRSNGFQNVEVTSRVETNFRGNERELGVFIEINEGPQWFVSDLSLSGVDLKLLPEVEAMLQSTAGQPYSNFNVATDRDNILNYYFNNGYPEARFESIVSPGPQPNTVRLQYIVEEGPRNFVRGILISGLEATSRNLVTSRIPITPGAPLSQSEMVESQRRLYDLGIFAKVDMAVQNPEGRERNKYVLYQFEEARRYSLTLGFGAEIARIGGGQGTLADPGGGAGFSPRVSLGLSRGNMFGVGHTLGLLSRVSNIQRRVVLNYLAPQFQGNENLNLSFSTLWDDSRNIRTFTSRRWEGSAQIGQRLSRSNTIQYRATFRRVTVDENTLVIRPDLIPVFAQPARVGLFSTTFIHDRRDDPIESHRGMYNTFDIGVAHRIFASQPQYTRMVWRNSTYHQIGRELVLARSFNFGWLKNFGDTEIPLPERFFAGGATAHRGFPENQAGPRDLVTGFPIGGNAFLVNSIELRFPLLGENLGGVIFHDAGNVYSDLDDINLRFRQRNTADFNYMVHSFGFGLRYRTPIGPIRVDFGFSPNSPRFVGFEGTREELLRGGGTPNVLQRIHQFQFHFSLGQTF